MRRTIWQNDPWPQLFATGVLREKQERISWINLSRQLNLSQFSQPLAEKYQWGSVRIGIIIIFHLSKLWKAKFILCDVISGAGLQDKFEIDRPSAAESWSGMRCGNYLLTEVERFTSHNWCPSGVSLSHCIDLIRVVECACATSRREGLMQSKIRQEKATLSYQRMQPKNAGTYDIWTIMTSRKLMRLVKSKSKWLRYD